MTSVLTQRSLMSVVKLERMLVIESLCTLFESLDYEDDSMAAAEVVRVIQTIAAGRKAAVLAEGRFGVAIAGKYPPNDPVWRHVSLESG